MSDEPAAPDPDPEAEMDTDPTVADLEAALVRQYVDRLEALDAEAERLLESFAAADADADTEPFDEPTRARARRHLREIRAQLHPLVVALRYRATDATDDGDGNPRDSI